MKLLRKWQRQQLHELCKRLNKQKDGYSYQLRGLKICKYNSMGKFIEVV